MPVDFNKMIEQHLHRDAWPKRVGNYYPSEAGNCLRKSWYSFKHPLPANPKSTKHFHLGNLLHDFMAEVLEDPRNAELKLLEKEVSVKINTPNFVVSGRMDDVFMLTADGRKFILEVKSTNSKLDWMEKPQDAHVMQLQLYMHAYGVHDGVILYLEKSSLEGKWFEIKYDQPAAEGVIARFAKLHESLTSGSLPEPEAKQKPDWAWMCRHCDYFDQCGQNAK